MGLRRSAWAYRLTAAVAVAGLVAACGNGDDDVAVTDPDDVTPMEATYDGPDIELDFWNGFTGGDGPFMRELVERFNEEHDNITVSMEVQDWGDYYEAVPAAVGTGRGPQIGIMHVDQLATNAARNVVAPLDDLVAVLELDENDFSEPVWNAGEFAGQRYGIPLDVHPLGFYYNRTLMEEAGLDPDDPPQDMASYMEALEALQDAGIQGNWISPHLFTGGLMYQSLLWQFGGELYTEDRPIFDLYGIEDEIDRALKRKVPLKSGGYVIFDQTEAMTTIDVNTGAYVGRRNLEETIFRTNLEAAAAIARQLRLRNLGGIIIIDFIDMAEEEHRRQVLQALTDRLGADHAKTQIMNISPLGLVEMTRKRNRESLEHVLCQPCPSCENRGFVKTAETICYEIFREILRQHKQFDFQELLILARPEVIERLLDEESTGVAELEELTGKPIRLQSEGTYVPDQFDVVLM
jgi:hypothetical protein